MRPIVLLRRVQHVPEVRSVPDVTCNAWESLFVYEVCRYDGLEP